MRYLRGEILGLFCGELGIRSSSRVAIAHSRQGILIWDLNSGIEFNVDFKDNTLATEPKPAPDSCFVIFHEPDPALLARLADPNLMPWSEERETLLSELEYRNLDHHAHARYPLLCMVTSLTTHLRSRLHPRRIFSRPPAASLP
jgi:hypothetical protein